MGAPHPAPRVRAAGHHPASGRLRQRPGRGVAAQQRAPAVLQDQLRRARLRQGRARPAPRGPRRDRPAGDAQGRVLDLLRRLRSARPRPGPPAALRHRVLDLLGRPRTATSRSASSRSKTPTATHGMPCGCSSTPPGTKAAPTSSPPPPTATDHPPPGGQQRWPLPRRSRPASRRRPSRPRRRAARRRRSRASLGVACRRARGARCSGWSCCCWCCSPAACSSSAPPAERRRASSPGRARSAASRAPASPPRNCRRSATGSPYRGPQLAEGRYRTTAYGPPWGGIQGAGQATSGGLAIGGGAPRWYLIAVDPLLIGHGQLVYAWPNPFGWRGPFLAADTGAAILGHRIDFYDWRGRLTQRRWGTRTARISASPIVRGGPDLTAPTADCPPPAARAASANGSDSSRAPSSDADRASPTSSRPPSATPGAPGLPPTSGATPASRSPSAAGRATPTPGPRPKACCSSPSASHRGPARRRSARR